MHNRTNKRNRKREREEIVELMAETFPKLMTDTQLQIQKPH